MLHADPPATLFPLLMPRRLQRLATIAAATVIATTLHAQAPVEKVHVVITGGKHAGTYDAVGTRAGCSANATGAGSFGNQLSSTKGDPKAFNSLQLIIPNAKAAAAGTAEFQMIIGFGPIMQRTGELEVNTIATEKKKTGSGNVKLKDSGKTADIEINATTASGDKIVATISCLSVLRM